VNCANPLGVRRNTQRTKVIFHCFLLFTLGAPIAVCLGEGTGVTYYLVILNGDGKAEVLTVPPGDDPRFIAKHYDLVDIYQTHAQAVARCEEANNCAVPRPVE
jgi:hypothetical protein